MPYDVAHWPSLDGNVQHLWCLFPLWCSLDIGNPFPEFFIFTKQVLPVRGPYSLQYRMAGCMPWPEVFCHVSFDFFASVSRDDFAGWLGRIIFQCVCFHSVHLSPARFFRQTCLSGCLCLRGLLVKKKGRDGCGCLGQMLLATRPLLNALAGWFCSTCICVFSLSLSLIHALYTVWLSAVLGLCRLNPFLIVDVGKRKQLFCLSRLVLCPEMCLKVFVLWLLGG